MNRRNVMMKSLQFILVTTLLVIIGSCDRNNCKNVVCQVNQQCLDGGCYCADGYEGTDCNALSNQRYTSNGGTFNVVETCYSSSSNFFNYTCYIIPSTQANRVLINNLFGIVASTTAFIRTDASTGKGTFIEIPQQQQGAFTYSWYRKLQ